MPALYTAAQNAQINNRIALIEFSDKLAQSDAYATVEQVEELCKKAGIKTAGGVFGSEEQDAFFSYYRCTLESRRYTDARYQVIFKYYFNCVGRGDVTARLTVS